MAVRAKFRCTSKDGGTVQFDAVTSGSEENKTWAKYTPSGQLRMQIDNPAASDQFEAGKEYYLDITPAE